MISKKYQTIYMWQLSQLSCECGFFLMTKAHRFSIFPFHQAGKVKLNISYTLSGNDLSDLQHIRCFHCL